MAANVTGSKTVTTSPTAHLSAALLTALLATPLENVTIVQLRQLMAALASSPQGHEPAATIGSLLK